MKGNRLDKFSYAGPIFHKINSEEEKNKNIQGGRCAGRDMNTKSPDNIINRCHSACTIVYNVTYLTGLVAVRAFAVNSYAVSITRPNFS
jgi:hypothetical protein